jgi:Uma2 family endonuclease
MSSSAYQIVKPPARYTVEQYLAMERASEERQEYINGEIIAMAGEKLPHGIISVNILGILHPQLKGPRCMIAATNSRDIEPGARR